MDRLISVAQASEMLGITVKTLKIWANEEKIKSYRTAGMHRRFRVSDIEKFLGGQVESVETIKNVFVYCRVSTKEQAESGDLESQKERLTDYCNEKSYNIVRTYEEIGSGLNDNRRELLKMFSRIGEVNCIVVEHTDMLAKAGFNYLKEFAKYHGVEIESVEQNEWQGQPEEMVTDLVSVVTSFSSGLYGIKGGRKLKKVRAELETERCENSN